MSGPTTVLILSAMALVVVWLYGAAKKAQGRLDAETAAGKRAVAALKTRERIEDEISDDTDLVRRAANAGVVRPNPGK